MLMISEQEIKKTWKESYGLEPLVSISCTAYNHEKYIESALDSFLMQITNFPFEIVIHDDASTDHTAEIIHKYQEKYPSIINAIYETINQYSKHDGSLLRIINQNIRGKYIAFCEGDDYWVDNFKLQKQIDYLETHRDSSACVHNTKRINLLTKKTDIMYSNEDRDLGFIDCVKGGGQSFQTSSLIVRSELYLNKPKFTAAVPGIGDYPNAIYYSMCGTIHYFHDIMSVYRCGTEGSWTMRVSNDRTQMQNIIDAQIDMLTQADQYSGGKYHEVFLSVIEYNLFRKKIYCQEYREVVHDKHFTGLSFKARLKYRILSCFPFISSLIDIIRERQLKNVK